MTDRTGRIIIDDPPALTMEEVNKLRREFFHMAVDQSSVPAIIILAKSHAKRSDQPD